ncbi:hypothetical protein P376_0494 [Streptomyces sp. HCCB10043]|nr:hypothetical protein P376_0494 [Streptomyces sp. HCCB10043]
MGLGPGVRGVREQRPSGGRPPGRGGAVGRILGPPDELLGVVGGVVQLAALPRELLQHDVQQEPGELQPGALARHRRQRQEALGDIAVVLQHPGVVPGPAVLGGTGQPGHLAQMHPDEQIGGLGGPLHEVGPVEVGAGLGEGGDGEPVPGGNDFVVPPRARPLVTGGQQPGAYAGDARGVNGSGVPRQPQHGGAFLEGPVLGHPEISSGEGAIVLPQHLTQLRGRPHVIGALDMLTVRVLAVGVQRGGEPALGGPQLPHHEVGGLQGDPAGLVRPGGPPEVGVHPAEQGVVVEHLLEVRDDPLPVHGVPREPAAELVVDPATGHRRTGVGSHLEGALGPGPRIMPQQELHDHGRRELGRAPEPAVLLVVLPGQPEQGLRHLGLPRHPVPTVDQRPPREIGDDPPGDLGDLVTPVGPGGRDPFQNLLEGGRAVPGLGREVGPEVEGFGVRREKHGHRPPTVPGGRLNGLHVHGVDVGPLLPVDLHGHEVRVEVGGGVVVLEGLVGHDVAPVTAGVPDAEQHGHIPLPGLLERLGRPGPPVDGVVGVLEEVRGGGLRKSVGHGPILAHRSPRRGCATGRGGEGAGGAGGRPLRRARFRCRAAGQHRAVG